MNRQDVEKFLTESIKPIFGFALKRCKNVHDAEDLSQEMSSPGVPRAAGKGGRRGYG